MHRSPITLFALLFIAFLAVSAGAQSSPASPKPGSGLPETPLPNTLPPQNQSPQPSPATTDTKPDATAPTPTPTPSPAPAAAQTTPTQQKEDQPKEDQQKDDQPKSDSKQNRMGPTPTPTPQEEPPVAKPKTEILDSSATSGALTTDGHDPILDPPPVPRTTTTLVGGTITGVDRMRNRLSIHVFGGGHWQVNFDERTHIFHNGAETTQLALKKGERVYIDTQLDNNQHDIFARNIRVGVVSLPADADGQIVDVDLRHSEVTLRDVINSVPVRFSVNPETRISSGQTPTALKDVLPGALVHVRFAAESPNRGLAREIDILAKPGANFTFAGKVTFLDMHRGILAVQNTNDDKNYEIHFTGFSAPNRANLAVGVQVSVVATFEGSKYSAQSVTIAKPPDEEK